MPLDEFLSEATDLLASRPDATQVLVKRVERLRFAEVNGTYGEVLAALGGLYR